MIVETRLLSNLPEWEHLQAYADRLKDAQYEYVNMMPCYGKYTSL